MHVFGQWEEAGRPGEDPHMHEENMHTPHIKHQMRLEPGTFLDTELTTTPITQSLFIYGHLFIYPKCDVN